MPIVDYPSSSEDEREPIKSAARVASNDAEGRETAKPVKRRKILPSVPSSYVVDPGDDPSLHQGRTRSRPFVPGELNAHIYLNLEISRVLRRELDQLVQKAQTLLPEYTMHSLLSTPTPSQTPGELHVSLTHPLPLRRSQVDGFKAELSAALSGRNRRHGNDLRCSLSGRVSVYYNGKATGGEGAGGRAFLALRLGAGSNQVESIVDRAIHPLLSKHHLPLYHENPEYHASFAWCLTRHPQPGLPGSRLETLEEQMSAPPTEQGPFDRTVLDDLNRHFEKALLVSQPQGGWVIPHLILRIGKSIHEIPL